MTSRTRPTCPKCKSLLVPYVYGYPVGPPPEDGSADDFFIAGCLIDYPSPKWGCRACYNRIGDDNDD